MENKHVFVIKKVGLGLIALILSTTALASEETVQGFTLDGRLYDDVGATTPMIDTGTIAIQILDSQQTCILYEETQNFDTTASGGNINIRVGESTSAHGKRSSNDSGHTLASIVVNNGGTLSGKKVADSSPCTATLTAGSTRFVRLIARPASNPVAHALTPFPLDAAPSSWVAETLQGIGPAGFVKINNGAPSAVTQANLESVFSVTNYPILMGLLGNGANGYVPSASNGSVPLPSFASTPSSPQAGQIWYDSSGVLKFWNGSSAQTLDVAGSGITSLTVGTGLTPTGTITSSGSIAVDVGTSDGQIVQVQTGGKLPSLDGSNLTNVTASAFSSTGSISTSGSIAANSGNFRSLTLTNASSQSVTFQPAATITGSPLTFTWPGSYPGVAGYVLSSDASGNLSWVSPTTGSLTAVSNQASLSNGKVWIGDASGKAQENTLSGDVAMTNAGVTTVNGIKGVSVTAAPATAGQVLRYDGTNLAPAFISMFDLRSTVTGTQAFGGVGCLNNQTLTWTAATDNLACSNISLPVSQLTGTLPVANGGTGSTTQTWVDLTTAQTVAGVKTWSNDAIFNGNVGVGTATPTASLHLRAGVAAAGGAPLKLTAGTNLTTPEPGAIEFDGSSLFYTDNSNVRHSLALGGSAISALTGDVTASGSGSVAATVAQVGGVTAANVASGANAANAATSSNTASTIVARDASGNFAASSITMGSDVLKGSTSGTLTQTVPATVTSYTLTWPAGVTGTSGYVLSSDTSGNLSWVSPTTGSLTAVSNQASLSDGKVWIGDGSNKAQENVISGDMTISNTGVASLKNTGTAGTYFKVTTDAQGRVSSGVNPTTLSGFGITDAVQNAGSTPSIQTGLDASKPAFGSAGRLYVATDTQKIYTDTGAAWSTIASNSGTGISSLTSDVSASGTGSVAATVNSVGGSTAANIHTAEVLANAATDLNTASTIVKRDASGNFAASSITMGSDVLKGSTSGTLTQAVPATVTSYTLTWPAGVAGTSGYVLSSDTSGNLSWISPTTGSLTAVSNQASLANGKVWIGDGTGKAQENTLSGDVTMTNTGVSTVAKVDGVSYPASPSTNTVPVVTSANTITYETLPIAAGGTGSTTQNFVDLTTAQTVAGIKKWSSNAIFNGNVGIGTTGPSAQLNIAAGTASAGTAPLKLTAGTNLTAPEPGAIEFDGSSLYYTDNSSVRHALAAAGSGLTALTGDVSASGSGSVAATVNSVGGSTAANVHTAEILANAATNTNTASTIVKRDASGNFAAGAVTMGSEILKGSTSGTLTNAVPATVTSYTLTWPSAVTSTAGYVLSSDASGNLSWISPTTGSLTAVSNQASLADGKVWIGDGTGKAQENTMSGDVSMTDTGVTTVAKVNGVSYPASPSTNTVPVVTGAGTVTYGTVPNAALTNSSVTLGTTSVSLGGTASTLAGLTSVSQGSSILAGSTSGTITNTVPATVTSYTLTWPSAVTGTAGFVLSSDTSGNLSWISPTTGSLTAVSNQATLTNGKFWIGDGSNIAQENTMSGDVTFTNTGVATVGGVKGKTVSAAPTAAGQVLRYDGTNWTPNYISMFDLRSTVTGSATFGSGSVGCLSSQTLTWTAATDNLACTDISLPVGQVTGTLPVANGGTGATTLAANQLILGNGTSAVSSLPTGSSGQMLQSAGASAPAWSTATYPSTTTINQILFSSAANTVTGLATGNTGALVTSSTGVPSFTSGATANRLLRTDGTTVSFAQAALTTDVTGVLPVANGGTGSNAQSWVDLTTAQTAAGIKTWSSNAIFNGSVGIGTSVPGASLDVTGAIRKEFTNTAASTTSYWQLAANDGAGNWNEYINSTGTASPTAVTEGGAFRRLFNPGLVASGTNVLLEEYAAPVTAGSAQTWLDYMQVDAKNSYVNLLPAGGKVGIGTNTPAAALDVTGQVYSRSKNNAASLTFNFNNGNVQYTSSSCGAVTLQNMQDGGSYTVIVQGGTAATCTFSNGGDTFKFIPANSATIAGTQAIYNMTKAGSIVYVNWMTGY